MKIESSATPTTSITTSTPHKDVAKAAKPRKTVSKSEVSKQRIGSWFTRVGISPNASPSNFQERTQVARRHQEIRKVQRVENLHSIMTMAMDVAVGDVSEEQIDADWFNAFIDLAENIYSAEMQELWGKILAVEVSRPGSFSLRSLETLKLLTQKDAQLFSNACRLASRRVGDATPRILLHYHQRRTLSRWFFTQRNEPVNIANYGLSYPALLTLIDLGLLMPTEIEGAEFPVAQAIHFRCGETAFKLTAKRSGLALSYYKFTAVGAELFRLAKRHEQPDYYQALKAVLSPAFMITD